MDKLEILLNWYIINEYFFPGPNNKHYKNNSAILDHYKCHNYDELFLKYINGEIRFFKIYTDQFTFWIDFCDGLWKFQQPHDNKFIEDAINFLEKKNIFDYKRLPWISSKKIISILDKFKMCMPSDFMK